MWVTFAISLSEGIGGNYVKNRITTNRYTKWCGSKINDNNYVEVKVPRTNTTIKWGMKIKIEDNQALERPSEKKVYKSLLLIN